MQTPVVDKDKKERVLLVAEVKNFSERNDFTSMQFIITKSKLILAMNENIVRDIHLHKIDALTLSRTSNEFIVHVYHDSDERFSAPTQKKEIIEMLLYLLSYRRTESRSPQNKTKIYFVENAKLDLYVTTKEDLEDGHLIRPDKKNLVHLDFQEFVLMDETQNNLFAKPIFPKIKADNFANSASISEFNFLKTLGKGSHGKVLLAERTCNPNEQFAIKILKKKHVIDSKQLEHTITEKKILSTFSHPFLVSLKQALHTDTKIYFVMEFLKGGELFQHLKRVVRFKEEQAKFFVACLVSAIGHLHNADYIYRDLKPENILLDELGYAKLTDFGLAKFLKVSDLAKTFCGTPEYLAPEVILNKGCNRAADWWSLGILTYEMLFGAPPFYTKDVQEMYKRTLLNQVKFPTKNNVSRAGLDFIAGLLVKVPSRRLGSIADALEVMNHPWFAGFDWAALNAKTLQPPFKPQSLNWETNFDPDFIKEEPRDSKCELDLDLLAQFSKEFAAFSEIEPTPIENMNFDIKLGAIFRDNLLKEIHAEIAKESILPNGKPDAFDDGIDDTDLPLQLTAQEIDKENPNKKTPLKSKTPTPKKPFGVIYVSQKPPEFDPSEPSKEEEFKTPEVLNAKQ